MPVEVLHGFEEAFDCKVLEGYGLSETCRSPRSTTPTGSARRARSGCRSTDVEMRLVDEDGNEVPRARSARSPSAARPHEGLLEPPGRHARDAPDGWLNTGDMARRDEGGYYYIVDRKKEIVIRGGFNVYPREIEEVLYEHQAVAHAA